MRISPIAFNAYKKVPNFGTTDRATYIHKDGTTNTIDYDHGFRRKIQADYAVLSEKVLCANYTCFFRDDIYWRGLGEMLDKLFPNKDEKVNVYNFACSDGSEAYSLAISLIEQLGEEGAKRFFPIKASDVDEELVDIANGRKILAKESDINAINYMTEGNFSKYFRVMNKLQRGVYLEPTEVLKNAVEFSSKDIEDGLDEIESSNSLILCRNFWRYLSKDKLVRVAQKLYENTDKSSKIIIGDFDMVRFALPPFFEEFGLMPASNCNNERYILEKREGCATYNDYQQTQMYKSLKNYCTFAK